MICSRGLHRRRLHWTNCPTAANLLGVTMYFIAIKTTLSGYKPVSRLLYSTKQQAEEAIRLCYTVSELKVFNKDHEPGRSILNKIGPG